MSASVSVADSDDDRRGLGVAVSMATLSRRRILSSFRIPAAHSALNRSSMPGSIMVCLARGPRQCLPDGRKFGPAKKPPSRKTLSPVLAASAPATRAISVLACSRRQNQACTIADSHLQGAPINRLAPGYRQRNRRQVYCSCSMRPMPIQRHPAQSRRLTSQTRRCCVCVLSPKPMA